jgi:hypothetical protein
MYAVGWLGTQLYGLFAKNDGSDPGWQAVASWPAVSSEVLGAAASYDGTSILALASSDDGARVFQVTPTVGNIPASKKLGTMKRLPSSVLPVDHSGVGLGKYVPLLRCTGLRSFYALYTDTSGGRRSGAILATADGGTTWTKLGGGKPVSGPTGLTGIAGQLPDELFFGLATAPRGAQAPRLFAATDRRVYSSDDGGTVWSSSSKGLPRRPHCSHLEVAASAGGGADIFLSTFGWGLWRAHMS